MTDQNTLNSTDNSPTVKPGTEINEETENITFMMMCVALGLPEYKVRYQIGALAIKHEYKVGAARIFSLASFLRIKSGILGTANRKAAAAI